MLVYEPNYPRVRGPIRPLYVLEKLMLALGTIAVANYVAATAFVPVAECMSRLDPFAAVLQLAAPSMLVVVSVFFVVFECILNGVAGEVHCCWCTGAVATLAVLYLPLCLFQPSPPLLLPHMPACRADALRGPPLLRRLVGQHLLL